MTTTQENSTLTPTTTTTVVPSIVETDKPQYIRQGDVYIFRAKEDHFENNQKALPDDLVQPGWADGVEGRLLPLGGRGSDHVIATDDVARCTRYEWQGRIYLRVKGSGLVTVEHPEHPPVYLEEGLWRIEPQTAIRPQGVSRVWLD
ncbi:MAG: hypothetical protein D6812_02815 [Deltaproteobacteria bacterium]|nr:MAG: hypothetical protein D6812_02815 [Deltaproteobacteria bacterium]